MVNQQAQLAALITQYKSKLLRALNHLEYSYRKAKTLTTDPRQMDDEKLEVWEGYSARFARATDLYLSKYIRTKILQHDPAFSGSMRDFLDQAEKLGFIDDASLWFEIRAMRNMTVHEYEDEKLKIFFDRLFQLTPQVLAIRTTL